MSSSTSPQQHQPGPAPLLTVRTTLVFLTAAFIGLIVGGLTFLGDGSPARAVLAGLTMFGLGVTAVHKLID